MTVQSGLLNALAARQLQQPCSPTRQHVCAAVSEDRKYAGSHEWAKVDGDVATIGISDFAQVLLFLVTLFASQWI